MPEYFTGGEDNEPLQSSEINTGGIGNMTQSNNPAMGSGNFDANASYENKLTRLTRDAQGNPIFVPVSNDPKAVQASNYANQNYSQYWTRADQGTKNKKGNYDNLPGYSQLTTDPNEFGSFVDYGNYDDWREDIRRGDSAYSSRLARMENSPGYSANQKEFSKANRLVKENEYLFDDQGAFTGVRQQVDLPKNADNPFFTPTGGFRNVAFEQPKNRFGGLTIKGAAHPSEFIGYNGDPSMLLAMMFGGPFISEYAYGGVPEYQEGGWPSGSANIAPDENWGKTKLYEGMDPQKKAQIAKMAFDAGTAGLTMLGNAITEPRSNYSEMTSADRVFTTDPLMQRGTDGTLGNYQGLASDQSMVSMGAKNTGRTAGINRYGGVPEYQEGGTYDLTEEEIAQIMRMGGKVEFL
jgi:hypothetical protein